MHSLDILQFLAKEAVGMERIHGSSEAMVNIQKQSICRWSLFERDRRTAGRTVTEVHGKL